MISQTVRIGEVPPAMMGFVPPLMRRRLSPLQRMVFTLADALTEGGKVRCPLFFASRDGEDSLTRKLVESYNAAGDVSPGRFSTSVYNAAPGLYSILTENRASYGALAAGEETVECGLLEAVLAAGERVWIHAEETEGGYGCGARFADPAAGVQGRAVSCLAGDPSRPPLTFAAVADFLSGTCNRLEGRYLTLVEGDGTIE
ncbi:MAG: beta-ketoacyl synthase chain length factor [Kiritimatiellae bacterium]|nr:beta-ketoacyl synthase chain length factor [Kiritimatiellia bacterium]